MVNRKQNIPRDRGPTSSPVQCLLPPRLVSDHPREENVSWIYRISSSSHELFIEYIHRLKSHDDDDNQYNPLEGNDSTFSHFLPFPVSDESPPFDCALNHGDDGCNTSK